MYITTCRRNSHNLFSGNASSCLIQIWRQILIEFSGFENSLQTKFLHSFSGFLFCAAELKLGLQISGHRKFNMKKNLFILCSPFWIHHLEYGQLKKLLHSDSESVMKKVPRTIFQKNTIISLNLVYKIYYLYFYHKK